MRVPHGRTTGVTHDTATGVTGDAARVSPVTPKEKDLSQVESKSSPLPPNPSRLPSAAGLGVEVRTACAVPDDIRQRAVDEPGLGEGWAQRWLDPSAWDETNRTIIPASDVARQRIHWCLGRHLSDDGVTIGHPGSPPFGRRG
jgi:hypothetical protein